MGTQRIALNLLVIGLLLVGMALGFGVLPTMQAAAPGTLFGVAHSGPNGPSSLYTLDTVTGDATLIGPIGFERCGGIDFSPTGILYAVCERMDGSNTNVLVVVDPSTGIGTEIGPTGIEALGFAALQDLSIRSDGTIFGYLGVLDGLAIFDPETGAATRIGFTGLANSGNGLAFSADGTLYNAGGSASTPGIGALYTLNTNTSSATFFISLIFSPPADNRPRINAMDFEPGTEILFGSLNDRLLDQPPENYLSIIDLETGDVNVVGPTIDGLDALAFSEVNEPAAVDLTAQKSNNMGGTGEVGTPFNWTINMANTGSLDATFDSGEVLLQDVLPSSPTYGPPTSGNFSGITGSNFISCSMASQTLTCTASGGSVTIGSSGSFDVVFSVTPTIPGTLDNPAQDGICQVDPANQEVEADENNNNCADSVIVEEEPTVIDLVSFGVEANNGQAIITWETATEIDNAGFNIYRAQSIAGPWIQVNSALIGAQGDPVSGAQYSFVDTPGRGSFYYRLEDIDFFGLSTLHEPALVEMGAAIRVPWYRPIPPESE